MYAVLQVWSRNQYKIRLYELAEALNPSKGWPLQQQVMPDDHSKVAPLLPIPNRTVKRLSADDSAHSRVKVGHRQAPIQQNAHSLEWAILSLFRPRDGLRVLKSVALGAPVFREVEGFFKFFRQNA